MSKKCRAYSESRLGFEPSDNRKAFYAGWDAAMSERLAQPWEKFCDTHCTAFDHHPDCKLAQPVQEYIIDCPRCGHCCPQPRQWQGLTGDEIWHEWLEQSKPERDTRNFVAAFARTIEAKLREKNQKENPGVL